MKSRIRRQLGAGKHRGNGGGSREDQAMLDGLGARRIRGPTRMGDVCRRLRAGGVRMLLSAAAPNAEGNANDVRPIAVKD